jgi:hypothetical protein
MLPILEQMRTGIVPANETDTTVTVVKKIKCQDCLNFDADDTRSVQVGGIAQYMVHSGMPRCKACSGQTCLAARSDKHGRCGTKAKLFVPVDNQVSETITEGSENISPAVNENIPQTVVGKTPRPKRPSELKKEAERRGLASRLPLEQQVKGPAAGVVPVNFVDDGDVDGGITS